MAEYSSAMPDYPDEPEKRARATPRRQTQLDEVASDLAYWIDDTASKIALAFAPGRAPFAAQVTEQQKLEYYKQQLFHEDGSPNTNGRSKELARLGAEGFGAVYKAVVRAYPQLAPRAAANPDSIDALAPPQPPPPMMPMQGGPMP